MHTNTCNRSHKYSGKKIIINKTFRTKKRIRGYRSLSYILLQELAVDESGLRVREGPGRGGVSVAGGEDLDDVLELARPLGQELEQRCEERGVSAVSMRRGTGSPCVLAEEQTYKLWLSLGRARAEMQPLHQPPRDFPNGPDLECLKTAHKQNEDIFGNKLH